MRVLVLGGTIFIGRAIVEALVAAGHEPMVVHRGHSEPGHGPVTTVPHLHTHRADLARHRASIDSFAAEAVIDCMAMTGAGASAALDALAGLRARWVVLSSMDVYRAFASLTAGRVTDAVPVDEDSPVREDRHPYPDIDPAYSKLDVEDVVLRAGAVVLRLPMVYGPHDPQRREEPILRQVRDGGTRVTIGTAGGLLPRGFVHDIARGAVAACTAGAEVEGQVLNLCEERTLPARLWVEAIVRAAGSPAEIVTVADSELPPDLALTGALAQPFVASTARARRALGYTDTPVDEAIATSVRWHLAHPPPPAGGAPA